MWLIGYCLVILNLNQIEEGQNEKNHWKLNKSQLTLIWPLCKCWPFIENSWYFYAILPIFKIWLGVGEIIFEIMISINFVGIKFHAYWRISRHNGPEGLLFMTLNTGIIICLFFSLLILYILFVLLRATFSVIVLTLKPLLIC